MKQTVRRLMSLALVLTFVLSFTACGSADKEETNAMAEAMSESLIGSAQQLTEAIVALPDEQIEAYKASGDEFTMSAMEAWESSRDELGDYVGIGDAAFEEISDGYAVTIPAEFSDRNVEIVYTFDDEGTPTSLVFNPEYTFSEKMMQALMNTIVGVLVVFVVLIFLCLLISLFKYISIAENKLAEKKNKKSDAPAAAPAPKAAPAAVQGTDDAQLVAVIAAAIAEYEGTTTDGFVVRSIRKVNRSKW